MSVHVYCSGVLCRVKRKNSLLSRRSTIWLARETTQCVTFLKDQGSYILMNVLHVVYTCMYLFEWSHP